MKASKILQSHILDIIFDGKNKQYGAYQLRKSYNYTLSKSLILTLSIAFIFFMVRAIIPSKEVKKEDRIKFVDTEMVEIKKELPVIPPPKQIIKPVEVNQVRFTPPLIVKDDIVKDVVESIQEDQAISIKTVESDVEGKIVVKAPIETSGSSVVEAPKNDETLYTIVEIESKFPGGTEAWLNYLRKNLNTEILFDNSAPEGAYTVIVKFVVSKDGSISDIVCENDPGFGVCEEAKRVIRKTKQWIPAIQNGHNVNSYRRQPITFLVQ